jgi:hypothetical protein
MGIHAAKLYHISSAMKAFQQDLRARGIEDKVLTVTTSEFGRRISSNGSYGTDHGTGAPLFVFGRGVIPGMSGTNPDISPGVDNVPMQFDYRQIYANILLAWMGVDKTVLSNDIFFGNFIDGPRTGGGFYEKLPIAGDQITALEPFIQERFYLKEPYPNPVSSETLIEFFVNRTALVRMSLLDHSGRSIKTLFDKEVAPGTHKLRLAVDGLKTGVYIIHFDTGLNKDSKKIIIKE